MTVSENLRIFQFISCMCTVERGDTGMLQLGIFVFLLTLPGCEVMSLTGTHNPGYNYYNVGYFEGFFMLGLNIGL